MTAIESLNNVLVLLKLFKDNSQILEYFEKHKIIRASFEQRYLANNNDYEFRLIKTVNSNRELAEFYLEAMDSCPYKIEMAFDGNWYLKTFLFQCQGCFGEDKECLVCGGSGWGVL